MSQISCLSCRAVFQSMEERDQHFKLPWHSYNVKRKVHGLDPVSEQVYEERQKQLDQLENKAKDSYTGYCDVCKKTFSNSNQLDNHMQSKKHKQAQHEKEERERRTGIVEPPKVFPKKTEKSELSPENDDNAEEEEEEEKPTFIPEVFEPNSCRCLFCRKISDTTEDNLVHMMKYHSFIIPDPEYLEDLDGLLQYLGEKISRGCFCLYCNRGFHDANSVRQHMLDASHSKIKYEEDDEVDEYAPFYDYSTQEDTLDEDSIGVSYTGELCLPDGRLVGHRSLFRYYKQKFDPQYDNRRIMENKLLLEYHELQNTSSSAIIKYTPQQVSERQKQLAVQRVDSYHQRLRLDAGMRMNKIHLNHFSHR
ncbi:hypothetical protein WA158_006580 [Blastocystis sp. Blastoise]